MTTLADTAARMATLALIKRAMGGSTAGVAAIEGDLDDTPTGRIAACAVAGWLLDLPPGWTIRNARGQDMPVHEVAETVWAWAKRATVPDADGGTS